MGICFPSKAVELKMASPEIKVQLAIAQNLRTLNHWFLGLSLGRVWVSEGE